MTKPYEENKIKISLLDLDKKNPRFLMLYKDSDNEEDIIRYLLENENAIDIVKSIIKNNDYFPDSFCYVVEKNGRYTVKEGNRRIAALKALAEPKKFLKGKYSEFKVSEVPCLIYSDEKKLAEKIAEKHTQSEVKGWSRLAQGAYIQNYINEGNNLSDLKYLREYKNLYKLYKLWEATSKKGYGDKFKTLLIEWNRATLIERFFSYEDILLHMGFGFDNASCEILIFDETVFRRSIEDFIKWLNPKNAEKITTQMITKNTIYNYFNKHFFNYKLPSEQLNVLDSNLNDDNKDIDCLLNKDVELNINKAKFEDKKNQESDKEKNICGQELLIKKIKTRAHSNDRKTYLPTGFALSIKGDGREKDIFCELRKLSPINKNLKNTFAIMTRVFLEMSLDFYGTHNISNYKNKNINSKKYELWEKMKDVIDYLKTNNQLSQQEYDVLYKYTNNNKTDFINIHTLHQYVHNSNIFPKDDDLKTTWDNLGTLLQIIWSPMEDV